jgi:translation elongation factor EF-4
MQPPSNVQGIGIEEILEAVVQRIPPPPETLQQPLRALIFDSYYDPYKAGSAVSLVIAMAAFYAALGF